MDGWMDGWISYYMDLDKDMDGIEHTNYGTSARVQYIHNADFEELCNV